MWLQLVSKIKFLGGAVLSVLIGVQTYSGGDGESVDVSGGCVVLVTSLGGLVGVSSVLGASVMGASVFSVPRRSLSLKSFRHRP